MSKTTINAAMPTVEQIRESLRDAIFMISFEASHRITASQVNSDPDVVADLLSGAEMFRQLGCNMIVFGINSNLLSIEEANMWKDAIFDKEGSPCLADVAERFEEENPTYTQMEIAEGRGPEPQKDCGNEVGDNQLPNDRTGDMID